MARKSRCSIWINGNKVEGAKSYQAGDEEIARAVRLLGKMDYIDVDPENTFTFDEATKKGQLRPKYKELLDGNAEVKILIKGGDYELWGECKLMNTSSSVLDGENEWVQTLTVFGVTREAE